MFWFSLSAGYGNHKWDHLQSTVSLFPHFIDTRSGYQQLGTTACLSVLLNFWLAFSHLACVGSGHQQLGTTTCTLVLFELLFLLIISLTFCFFFSSERRTGSPAPSFCPSRHFWPTVFAFTPRSFFCSFLCSCFVHWELLRDPGLPRVLGGF